MLYLTSVPKVKNKVSFTAVIGFPGLQKLDGVFIQSWLLSTIKNKMKLCMAVCRAPRTRLLMELAQSGPEYAKERKGQGAFLTVKPYSHVSTFAVPAHLHSGKQN